MVVHLDIRLCGAVQSENGIQSGAKPHFQNSDIGHSQFKGLFQTFVHENVLRLRICTVHRMVGGSNRSVLYGLRTIAGFNYAQER